MKRTRELLNDYIKEIKEYVPGRSIEEIATQFNISPENIIKLGSNENPLGPSRMAMEAIGSMTGTINIYPSVDAADLRRALADFVGFPPEQVVLGAGMDGVVDTMMRLFIRPGTGGIITTPTFSYFEIALRTAGGTPVFVKRLPDYSVDTEAVISAINDSIRMIYLVSPNNPSGNTIPESDVKKIVESTDALVFLDEAYIDFAGQTLTTLVSEYENLVVGRTMSKAMGLAGLRIGYAIVPEWIYREYYKATTPFAISRIAEAAGMAALKDEEYRRRTIENVVVGREFLTEKLASHCRVYPSEANFIMIDVSPRNSRKVTEDLLKMGIIVRDCSSFRDAPGGLIRITVGTPEQNRKVAEALIGILGS